MFLFIFLLHICSVYCSLNITENSRKISFVLNEYKNDRLPRCVSFKLSEVLERSRGIFEKTQRFGEYIKYQNISSCCKDNDFQESYQTEHILSGLLLHENVPDTHWHEYKSVYRKKYCSHRREMSALSSWMENLRKVARHNQQYLSGVHSYTLQLNVFGDLGAADYFKKILKLFDTPALFDPAQDHHRTTFRKHSHRQAPKQVDWRAKGFRPKREEQWQCGACYAFAVTHALQAQLYKKHGDWPELSPQQILDCSAADGNSGCDGGSLRAAFRYAAREGLLDERHYPYKGKKDSCHYNPVNVKARVRRWALLPPGDEGAMERALATIGPLAVAVNAQPFTFQLYRSGIYDDPFCVPWQLNHAMLLVGYTPEYWLLLNWWGANWGEDGYMRIRRGFNRCGVANMAAYVEL